VDNDKIIRDKISQIIEYSGKEYIVHVTDDKDYISKLFSKPLEELDEFKEKLSP